MENQPCIAIVRTGAANLASVAAAFDRLNVSVRVLAAPHELDSNDALVVPGVGSFATGIAALQKNAWDQVLVERYQNDEPTLAICLGLQLLCKSSEEDPTAKGIGLLPANVKRLPKDKTVPQFGWNRIESNSDYFESGFAYYANSFCIGDIEIIRQNGWEVATTEYGIRFVAAVRKGRWLACQFHPELSGVYGQNLLRRWVNTTFGTQTDKQVKGVSTC